MAFTPSGGQVSCKDGSYVTKNFDICPVSQQRFDQLATNPTLQCEFALNEDQFLFYEKQAVRYGSPQKEVLMRIDSYMKLAYPMLNFDYHQQHINQATYPNEIINPAAWQAVGRR
jgi:hypothetical protein